MEEYSINGLLKLVIIPHNTLDPQISVIYNYTFQNTIKLSQHVYQFISLPPCEKVNRAPQPAILDSESN